MNLSLGRLAAVSREQRRALSHPTLEPACCFTVIVIYMCCTGYQRPATRRPPRPAPPPPPRPPSVGSTGRAAQSVSSEPARRLRPGRVSPRRAQASRAGGVWWPLAWCSVWCPWSRSSRLVWSARRSRFSCPRATRACWGCSTQLRRVCFWPRRLSTCWCARSCTVEGQRLQPL